ncbi:dihydropteroate synthase [Acidothermaceae bacterium B102]|nr:dihydropteroate synthase [Acidothermaceae bacterium B102]
MTDAPQVLGLPVLDRCRVFAVINVTPDSFSDGGHHLDTAAAVRHGLAMLNAGADVLDVGGESTRPGAARVSAQTEIARVLPVVSALAAAGAVVSVDTMRAEVAAAALAAGARIVNDVSGGLADPELPVLVAEARVPYVLMHWRGHSETMQAHAVYGDVVAEVRAELAQRLEAVVAAGVDPEQVVLDPGLGFAKTAEHNWALLAGLPSLMELGRPLLVGASRKAFLGRLLASAPDAPRPVDEREDATTAVTAIAALAGVWAVRVHEPQPSADAVLVAQAVRAQLRGWRSE